MRRTFSARPSARAAAARADADPARFFDVPYKRLTADPVGTVRDDAGHDDAGHEDLAHEDALQQDRRRLGTQGTRT